METLKARVWIVVFTLVFPTLSSVTAFAKIVSEPDRETVRTAHFVVHYPAHYRAFAEAATDRLEDSYRLLAPELGWRPRGAIEVVVRGDSDLTSDTAEVFPYDRIVLNAVPPEPWGFFSESDDWIRTLAVHELTHVIANDETSGLFNFLRSLIGSAAKINPYQPAWLVEGLAVYEETTKTSRGRGRSIWNDMIARVAMENSLFDGGRGDRGTDLRITLDRLNDGILPWPGPNSAYIFGYLLTAMMVERKGPDGPARISLANSGTFPFWIEGVARETLGEGYPELWRDGLARLRSGYAKDLPRIDREPETAFALVTRLGRRTRGLTEATPGHFYFIRDSERSGVGISSMESGKVAEVTDWKWDGGTRLRHTSDGRSLIYSRIVPDFTNSLYSEIFLYDLASGRETQLTYDGRGMDPEPSADFTWDADRRKIASGTLIYVKNQGDGNHAIVSLGKNLKETVLYSGRNFARLGAPVVGRNNHSGWVAFSEKGLTDGEHIKEIPIDLGDPGPRNLTLPTSRSEVATTPEWDFDGSLLYTTGAGGVFNLARVPSEEIGKPNPRSERITNFRSGGLQPTRFSPGGPLYAMVYGPAGWDFAKVTPGIFSPTGPGVSTFAEKIEPKRAIPLLEEVSVAPTERHPEGYSVLPALWPKYWAPDIRKVDDGWTLGVKTTNYDPWEDHRYSLFVGDDTRAHFPIWNLDYQYDGFYPTLDFSVRRENRYFATYQESNQIDTDEADILMPSGRTSYLLLGFTGSTSRLFEEKDTTGGFELGWLLDTMRIFDDSIDPSGERGVRAKAVVTGFIFNKEMGSASDQQRFSSFDSRIDFRFPSLIPRHFFRLATNYSRSNNENLSALYYVGGGEESIAGDADFLLRGYPQGTIFGRQILTSNFEYIFPLVDVFRGFGTFPVYFQRSRIKLFFDVGSAEYVGNETDSMSRWPNGVGIHLLSDFNLLYRVPVTLAVGFDSGLSRDLGGDNQVVVGLFSQFK